MGGLATLEEVDRNVMRAAITRESRLRNLKHPERKISRAHDMGQVYVMDKVITLFNNRKLTAKKILKKGENSLQKFKKNEVGT